MGGNHSIAAMLASLAAARGAAPALITEEGATSFVALDALTRRLAGGLARLGVGRGDRVAIWLPNVVEWLALAFAAARLGAVAVSINTRFRSSEIEDILGRSGAKVLALWPGFRAIPFLDILADVPGAALSRLEALLLVDRGEAPAALPPALAGKRVVGFAAAAAQEPVADQGGADDVCIIFTTSGTTKAPKFVAHTQRGIVAHARDVASALGYDAEGTVLLGPNPFCGVFGFCQATAALAAGRPFVTHRVFEAEAIVRDIARYRVTLTQATDEALARLLETTAEPRPFPSLAWIGYGAFNRDPAEFVRLAEARGVNLVGLYGMSEAQAFFACQARDAPAKERSEGGGLPVAAAGAVRVRDPESGELLAPGKTGEIEVKGPSLMAGYWNDPATTAAAMTADGFLRTGDAGYLRADGSFVYLARMGDALRLGGFLVSPVEIAAHLERHPMVAAAQVVGVRTPTGTRPVGFVVPQPGAGFDEAALRAHCLAGLAKYKVPDRFVALAQFPVTLSANGTKVQRAKLRDMAAALLRPGS